MKVYLDAMGGDNAPKEIIKGAIEAKAEKGYHIILVGKEETIREELKAQGQNPDSFEILNATETIEMDDDPIKAVRRKKDSSIVVGCKAIKGDDEAVFVSAGSTGAILAGASLFTGRVKGTKRPAIGVVLQGLEKPFLMMDNGANIECKPEHLLEFAKIGSLYMKKVYGLENPVVCLANNGTEDTKGSPLYKEANALLREKFDNFGGNIEMKQLFFGQADVIVCDGFTGNMILKTIEGSLTFAVKVLKGVLYKNTKNKLAGALIKNDITEAFSGFDPSATGGAPLFGIDGIVFKAHGSSDSTAIKNAVFKAVTFAESGFMKDVRECFAEKEETEEE